MGNHFEVFNKQKKIDYVEQAKTNFEESLKPLIGQLLQLLANDDFDNRSAAIKALARRSSRLYNDYISHLGVPEREAAALAAGEAWIKSLSNQALNLYKERNPSFKG